MSQETDKQNTTTSSPNDRDAARWYAFKVFYNKVFDIESHLLKTGIRSYLPSETITVERGGVRKKERRPLVPSLIFFQCGERLAEELRGGLEGRVLLYTREKNGKKIPSDIPDREMEIFMLVTSAGKAGLEYLGEDSPRFRKGEKVRVTGGQFKGAEGHICRIKGDRRLIVSIQGLCAVATSYIPQCYLEKIDDHDQ
ncbi:MAG TPA: UpxY family transcription antiterminator [Candidatus Coprenecus merdigallinarum]|nr:UpxY family transcription antiterminator [Candidatus Coprenecus merdigallinarum]